MTPGPVTSGSPTPQGVWPDGDGVNVAVWSSAATAIDLCLFDAEGRETRIRLPARTGEVFHGHVAGVSVGALYGLRAYGPYDPQLGLRFDPSKLLVDPFAVALDRPFALHPSMFPDSAPGEDSAPFTPKAIVTAQAEAARAPVCVPWDRTVVYEAHVKGLTRLHPEVPQAQRGTFAALSHPAVIAHLKALGVTTLELLPTAAWIDERHLVPLGLTNYWGYNPIAFAAPDPRLAPGGWAEVRAATGALAAAGIETILDVVFNHTGEGDALGPTLSLRGLDNAGYYRLRADPSHYVDDSGTGNTLALDRPHSVALVMHALRTWVRRGGVAGFRFDLATVMGRRADGFDPAAPLFAAIQQDPELSGLKLIAEPWDCGPGGYQLGRFPGAWGEWNDGFRERARGFWRGDASLGELAEVFAGSQAGFAAHRRPSRSVNFVTAHDGFTLADLVSFAAKHNLANGEDNRDGSNHDGSWNNGVEGPTNDPAVLARRAADQRALLATLMLARGTPMIAMGAELGHSQGGNNNAYAQDNASSWIDWAAADRDLLAFAPRLAQARADHPALRDDRFLTGEVQPHGFADVKWNRADGGPMAEGDWRSASTLACTLAHGGDEATLSRVVIAFHRADQATRLRLPPARDGWAWRIVLDTASHDRGGDVADDGLPLQARSVVLLAETPTTGRRAQGPTDETLASLAEQAGVAPVWWTIDGERHVVGRDTQRALLKALGHEVTSSEDARAAAWRLGEAARRPLPFVVCAKENQPLALGVNAVDGWLSIDTENGERSHVRIKDGQAQLAGLPIGRHRLRLADAQASLIVAPATAYEPTPPRKWRGVSAQLYSLTGSRDPGMGDFAALAELAAGAAAQGLDYVALNPLHALFPTDRARASPYYPSDRRFIDPIYIALEGDPSQPSAPGLIDYPAVWKRKSAALERSFGAFGGDAAFDAFVREGGPALRDFTLFQAIAEAHPGQSWRQWPAALRDAQGAEVKRFTQAHAERLRYHAYLQWLADRQLAGSAEGATLLRDLAVGPAPDGAEVWTQRDQFAEGVSIGAPPDAFGPDGQVWGLPPPLPQAWTTSGYAAFSELLRTNMRHAGGLRIDHVLGLSRLFWVPEGASGEDGAYVRYPLSDLLAVTALESVRARCLVVGEDLGTADEALRPALGAAGVYSYKVLPFEREGRAWRPPSAYPPQSLACVATHDLPPLEGWWTGADLQERLDLGLIDAGAFAAASAERALDKEALVEALVAVGLWNAASDGQAMSDALAAAIHAYVARSSSRLVLAQADDLAGEQTSVNVPGTHLERPNWRRRLSVPIPDLWNTPRAAAILEALKP